jgi:hypothetical protein
MDLYNVKDMCMPAKVYFALALIAVIMTSITSFNFSNIVFSIVVLILWSLLLNWICSLGFTGMSWALIIVPFVSILFTLIIGNQTINASNRNNPNNLTGSQASSLYGSLQTMEGQLNSFLSQNSTPYSTPNK